MSTFCVADENKKALTDKTAANVAFFVLNNALFNISTLSYERCRVRVDDEYEEKRDSR